MNLGKNKAKPRWTDEEIMFIYGNRHAPVKKLCSLYDARARANDYTARSHKAIYQYQNLCNIANEYLKQGEERISNYVAGYKDNILHVARTIDRNLGEKLKRDILPMKAKETQQPELFTPLQEIASEQPQNKFIYIMLMITGLSVGALFGVLI